MKAIINILVYHNSDDLFSFLFFRFLEEKIAGTNPKCKEIKSRGTKINKCVSCVE